MTNETSLVLEIWNVVSEQVQATKKQDIAVDIVRAFAEYGFEASDLTDLKFEDPYLEVACEIVFEENEEDEEEDEWDE